MPLDLTDFEPVDAQPVAALDMSDFEPVEAALDMSDFEVLPPPTTEPVDGATAQSKTASGSAVPVIEAPSAVPVEPAPKIPLTEQVFAPIGAGMVNAPKTLQQIAGTVAYHFWRPIDALVGTRESEKMAGFIAQKEREKQQNVADVQLSGGKFANIGANIGEQVAMLPVQLTGAGVGASIARNATAGAVKMSAALGGLQSAATEFGRNIKDWMDRGDDEDTAASKSILPSLGSGLVTAATTAAFGGTGIESVFAREGVQGLVRGSINALRQGGMEASEEATDEVGQIINDLVNNKKVTPTEAVKRVLLAGAMGGAFGGGVAGLHSAYETLKAQPQEAPAARTAAPAAEPSIDVIPPDFEPIAAEAEAAGAPMVADALRQTISETPQPAGGEINAEQITEAAQPDANVRQPEGPQVSAGQVPVDEGSQGVRPGGQAEEVARYQEIQAQLSAEVAKGGEMNPELVRESEEIKKRVPIEALTAAATPEIEQTGSTPVVGETAGAAVSPSAMIRPSPQALAFMPTNPVISWITGNAKRLFTAQGDLPKPVFQKWVERTGRVAQEAKATQFAVKDLYDSVAEEFKISAPKMLSEGLASVPEAFVDQMNTALSGDAAAMAALPPNVQSAVSKMRTHIDTLSEEMVRKGLVDSDLAAAISANQGTYLTRTYKIFEDKKWAEKIPTQVFNRARTFLHRELAAKNPAATVDDADRVLRNMLSDWASEGRDLRAKGGTLGSKDLTSFIKRKNIAPELRDVMGENRNIIHNYATSVAKTARFIADQEFLNHVRQIGTGQFLFTSDNAPEGFNTQIAAEGSQVLAPLNGMRTSPEIARAFAEWGKAGATDPGPILRALRVVNAWGKGVKTVGSLLTQARNLTGQPFFFLANGHFDMRPLKDAVSAVAGDMGLRSDAAARAIVLDAANYGLVGENAYAGEFREAWQEAMLNSSSDVPNEFATEFLGKRLIRKTVKGAERLYQTTDELGKIVGWMNERKRLAEMNPGTPDAEIKRMAAERIRNTYPTYSMSPQALRTFRQQPFFGPFATFWYETYRTTFHNLRYAIEDLKGPTEAHKKAGAQRLGGTMAVLSLAGFGVQMATKAMFGIDDKEEDDVRRMLPHWAQNAQLAFTGKEDKTYDFINLSYMNPYSTISDPIIGMVSGFQLGDNTDEMFGRGLTEVFRPFLSEQIATGAMIDVLRNRTKTGKRVFNPQDSWEVKAPAMFLHISAAAIMPGTIDRLFRRIIPAMKGEVSPYGRAPEPGKEVAAEFTGVRFESLDMKQALQFKTGRFINDENDAEQIFRSVASRRGTVAEKEMVDAYRSSEESRFELWQDLYRDYRAARRSGVSESEARQAMSARRLPKATIQDITAGRYRPYTPSDEMTRKAREYGHPLPISALREVRAKIPSVLQDVGRSSGGE